MRERLASDFPRTLLVQTLDKPAVVERLENTCVHEGRRVGAFGFGVFFGDAVQHRPDAAWARISESSKFLAYFEARRL